MRGKTILAIALVLFLAGAGGAVEWKGKLGVGVRGPIMAPLFKGANFDGSHEPFMMGWNPELNIKYGISSSFVVALSVGYTITYDDTTARTDQSFKLNNSDNASNKLTGINLGLTSQHYFMPQGSVQPYLLAGLGADLWKVEETVGGNSYNFTDLGAKLGAGINFWVAENFSIDIQGKVTYELTNLSADTPADPGIDLSDLKVRPFRGYLAPSIGLTYYFGGNPDKDNDGIKDKFDQCPDTPQGALVDQYGCPLDTDRDGLYDGLDKCPETPRGCVVDAAGCPTDSDKDGVCDGVDKCPDTPVDIPVDAKGCPIDSDADGVPDFRDKQADTPRGAQVDADGVAIDSDGDGIPDGIDKCASTPSGVSVDGYGCPIAKPMTGTLTLNIQYESGSFEPDPAARQNLDTIAETMKAYPNLKIAVNGYTDALGSESGNLKLSQKRADAVRDYLVGKGVDSARITSQGYGEKFPVADNGSPEGRQKNRRIEIVPSE